MRPRRRSQRPSWGILPLHDGFPRESRKDTVHRTVVVRPSQQMDRAAHPPVTGVLRLPDEGKPTMQHAWPHRARRRSREPTTSQSVAARIVRWVGNTCRAAPRAQAQLPCSVSSRAACLRSPPPPAGCCRLASAASRPFPRAHAALRPLVGLSPALRIAARDERVPWMLDGGEGDEIWPRRPQPWPDPSEDAVYVPTRAPART